MAFGKSQPTPAIYKMETIKPAADVAARAFLGFAMMSMCA